MAKEVMRRQASDNAYLHRDFHGALSAGIEYLDRHYGEDAVREYLRRFTVSYYAPLVKDVKARGLVALKEHFERIYAAEGGRIRATLSRDELILEVEACPAVAHMRAHGYAVARLFSETTRTVHEALCEGTPFAAQVLQYDERTGRSVTRFYRRRP
jgi:hypothetical protein